MKKSILIKLFSILLISALVMSFATNVLAADNTGYSDLTGTINTDKNTSNSNANKNVSNGNKVSNENNVSKQNANSSVYNNTNLPKTGVTDSIPGVALIVVFGISAIYAYKRIKDYRNI